MKIYVINGPNINMLGIREPHLYGKESYDTLISMMKEHAKKSGYDAVFFQSNHEV